MDTIRLIEIAYIILQVYKLWILVIPSLIVAFIVYVGEKSKHKILIASLWGMIAYIAFLILFSLNFLIMYYRVHRELNIPYALLLDPHFYYTDELDNYKLLYEKSINKIFASYRIYEPGTAGDGTIYFVQDQNTLIYFDENSQHKDYSGGYCPDLKVLDNINPKSYNVTCSDDNKYFGCLSRKACVVTKRN